MKAKLLSKKVIAFASNITNAVDDKGFELPSKNLPPIAQLRCLNFCICQLFIKRNKEN